MIKKLYIKNFKSLVDAEIDIRPLTLLIGPNSGGKSSILQPLVLLRQTVDSRDIENPLAIHGKYLDFGSYRDLISKHDDRKHLSISIVFETSRPLRFHRLHPSHKLPPFKKMAPQGIEVFFSTEFRYIRKSMRVIVHHILYEIPEIKARIEIKPPDGTGYTATLELDNKKFEATVQRLHKFYGASLSAAPIFTAVNSQREREKRIRLFLDFRYLTERLPEEIELLFNKLFYVGPLREWPKRFYIASGETPQDVGLKGEMAIDVLWIQSRRAATRKIMLTKVNQWLKQFGLASEVSLRGIGSNTYELRLTDPNTGLSVNIADAGFGASQVFPIVVQGFYTPEGSTLLIEQPEIHLHPRAQATLGDLLIEIGAEGRKTLIVETHSEHMIYRILRRIAEQRLKSEDVALYYCEPTPRGTSLRRIHIDSYGHLKTESLPAGFFEEDYEESMEHFKAVLAHGQPPER